MRKFNIASSLLAATFAIASAPALALAGNYAEGDPRPQTRVSQASTADVAAQTRQWQATAPTLGYPDGEPRATVQVSQKTRAQVNAEAVAWVASGMSQLAYGEIGMDSMGPIYRSALQAFNGLRSQSASAARAR